MDERGFNLSHLQSKLVGVFRWEGPIALIAVLQLFFDERKILKRRSLMEMLPETW